MRAAVLSAFGAEPALTEFAEPVAQPGETLVTVTAAALKQLDRAIASGRHYASPAALPVVCGTDGVGRDTAGRRVYFAVERRPWGAMAECAPASLTVPVPDGVDDRAAAAIVNPALGAWLPLAWRAQLEPGETVLVLGATGATGRLAGRAARLLGAGRVIAAGRNRAVLDRLDADETIDLTQDADALRRRFADLAGRGLDVVADYLWGPPAELLIETLARSDLAASGRRKPLRLVAVGEMAGARIALPSTVLRGSWLTILGSGSGNFPPPDRLRAYIAEILERTRTGEIGIDAQERPLADVAQCWTEPSAQRLVLCP